MIRTGLARALLPLTVAGAIAVSPTAEADSLADLAAKASPKGEVIWYESSPQEQSDRIIAAFNQRFPAIRITHIRDTGGNAIASRIIQEVQGDARTADIATSGDTLIWALRARDLVEKVDWVALGADPKLAPNQYGIATTAVIYVLLANTDLVSAAEAPKNWNDLLDPRWNGKIGTWIRAEGLVALAADWGEAKVTDYIEKLDTLHPFLFKSTFPLAQQVAAGEVSVALGLYHAAQPPVSRGAPIAVAFPDPVAVGFLYSFIPSAAKNKEGGELFALWLASAAGATAYEDATDRGNPLIAGTKTGQLLAGRKLAQFLPDQAEDEARLLERFNKLLAQGGNAVN